MDGDTGLQMYVSWQYPDDRDSILIRQVFPDDRGIPILVTPEPSTLALATLGALGLFIAARRKR